MVTWQVSLGEFFMRTTKRGLVISLAILLLITASILPTLLTAILGLLVIVLAATLWGVWGGISAAVYASIIVLLLFFSPGAGPLLMEMMAILMANLLVGFSWGYLFLIKKRQEQVEKTYHRAQKERKKRKGDYQEIFNVINDAIFIQDCETGDIIDLNEPALRMYGCSRKEEMIGAGKWDTFNHIEAGYTQERAQKMIQEALAKGSTFEWYARDKNGRPFWVEASVKITVIDGREGLLKVVRDITEHKQAQESIKQSEQKLNSILNNMQDVVWSLSWPEMELYYISPAVERMMGRSPQEFKEHPSLWKEITHPDDEGLNDEVLSQLLEEGKAVRECRIIRPDGRVVWIRDRSTLVYDENHKPIRLEGISSDITDKKEMEEQLQEREDRFQKMLALIPDMISIHDTKMNILYSNWNGFGAVPEEKRRLHTKCYETYRGYSHICSDCQARTVFETKRALQRELELPDGRWVDLRVIPILDKENRVDSFVEWVRDITDWKESERSLKEAEETYRNIFLNSQVGLFRTDIETGLILDANDVVAQFAGFQNREELLAEPFSIAERYVNPNDRERMISLVKAHGEFRNFEAPFRRNDGSTIRISFSGKLVPEKGWIEGVSEDITQRKKAEQQLAEYTEEVESLYLQLDDEINKARQVHERMLPKSLPLVEDISIVGYYGPAEKMGGDFYDVVHLGRQLVFFLSDVSGHGLDGSMLSLFVKHTIKGFLTFSSAAEITPEKILHYLARAFQEENYPEEYFICIFLAVLDLETMELTYAGAGFQDTPLVQMGNGRQRRLISKGLFISPVFSFDMFHFQEQRLILTPGTTIFFTTDGLTEQKAQGGYYMDRLPRVFYENAHRPPHLIHQVLLEDFRQFNSGSLQGNDDITFLVLQVQQDDEKNLQLELDTNFHELADMRRRVLDILEEENITAYRLLTCLNELVINAMEHGNKMDPNKKVLVELKVMEEYMQVSVQDQGEGFDWRDRIEQPMELEGQRERGRGIAMTGLLSDGLFYNDAGNQAMFVLSK